MITSQYTRSLNNLSIELNRLNTQVISGRKFAKSSENTSAAIKAFQIRRDMIRNESYKANIEHAKSSLSDAESALFHIEGLMKTASDKILYGLNGTQSTDERKIIATELRNIQDQLLQTLNSNSSDSYYFGGTNTTQKPFEVIGGTLHYNGQNLKDVIGNEAVFEALEKDTMFVDIGHNVQFDSVTGDVDDSTVFGYSIAGINIVGKGTTTINGDEISNNIYDLIGALADEFESANYTHDRADAIFGHFKESIGGISKAVTEIGAKTSYLDFMTERIEDKIFNLQERQLSVEGIDPAAAIIQFEAQKFAYSAALQMGAKIIQPTIFDFMS
jgi:flagellar hook-associated protein 3 FlgL